ncbi:MAG TPA: 50S ribosomal protein L9 [Thermomicrobiales bacterium]|nr:50S ribosomal protein L9 [Thermomicrobiales bacterium]
MKIILTQDVPKLGSSGTVQEVAPGFARNYLIPQGMAVIATRGSIKQVEERQAADARRVAKQEEELRGLSDRLQGMRVQIEARVGEQGRLFGSVTAADIAEKLAAQVGEEIDRRKIELDEPIRTVGEHAVTIRLVGRLQPTINVVVWDPENPHASTSDDPVAEAESVDEAEDVEPEESVAVVVAEDENDTETE